MIQADFNGSRSLKEMHLSRDIVVIGGGLSGVCAAITAARQGCKVALVQDRPVLGGNASSEVRLWALGATSHMGNNNRWAREGGIVDEIMVENTYRNKEGNPVIFDTVLIDKVLAEPNITLFLNTSVFHVQKDGDRIIQEIIGFNAQNSTLYHLSATEFIDASGDGIISYLAGVPYRIGAEGPEEFDEPLAPDIEDYGELLGHTLFFYSKKVEEPVRYIPPSYAIKDASIIPGLRNVEVGDHGCKLWWFEYGGRKDTIHDTEEIKMELWKVAYGIWDYIKNSGKLKGTENYTLEWVGLIPGKRESRRFEGEYMLNQSDLVQQKPHEDAISFGGWAMDLHPADGVYSDKPSCTQWHTKGVYAIPYRCYVPLGVDNLLLTGRIISASHVAFGSTRVMATCAHGGQAVGMAAAHAIRKDINPRELLEKQHLQALQADLVQMGHYIPQLEQEQRPGLLQQACISPSSTLQLTELPTSGKWETLTFSMAQMVPVQQQLPDFQLWLKASEATTISIELRKSSKRGNHSPDITLHSETFELQAGEQMISFQVPTLDLAGQYAFITVMKNEQVAIALSDHMITGIIAVYNQVNKAVSNFGKQEPPQGLGVDEFEFWCPKRRPKGGNMAISFAAPVYTFDSGHLCRSIYRPVAEPNAWAAALEDPQPQLTLRWEQPQAISSLQLFLDPDYDHPMETVQMDHHEHVMPFTIRGFSVLDEEGQPLAVVRDNYQAIVKIDFPTTLQTKVLHLKLEAPSDTVPASVFGIYINGQSQSLLNDN